MEENINELLKSLNLAKAASSFPVLENLRYFRDYNNYISNSFNRDKPLLDNNDQYTKPRELTAELITYLSEEKK